MTNKQKKRKVLLLAVGNEGRAVDGLGWAFARRVEALPAFDGDVEYRFQLQVEDALLAADYELVLFADACREQLPDGFDYLRCEPQEKVAYTTHFLTPGAVLSLSSDLYGAVPAAYLLRIQGEVWDLEIGLSPAARQHLERAVEWISDQLPAFEKSLFFK